MSFNPNIERKAPTDVCRECGAKLDLEQQLLQAQGKTPCTDCCDHVCSGECRRSGCNCACGEFHGDKDAPDAMDLPDEHSGQEELGRTDARLGLM